MPCQSSDFNTICIVLPNSYHAFLSMTILHVSNSHSLISWEELIKKTIEARRDNLSWLT
jgi:hypothetical protein